jgi:hypothetical protein
MGLGKLPTIIRETDFDKNGFARTKEGLLVPAYVASQLGFNAPGRQYLKEFYSRLKREAGVLPLCPFAACEEYLTLSGLDSCKTIDQLFGFWEEFNSIIGPVNYETLMPASKLMIAILDGGHALDDGVSAEIGYYAGEYKGSKPMVGIRSDYRLAENAAAPVNGAVRYFLDSIRYNGSLFTGFGAYDAALASIAQLTEQMRQKPESPLHWTLNRRVTTYLSR